MRAAVIAGQRWPHPRRLRRPDRLRHDVAEDAEDTRQEGVADARRKSAESRRRDHERSFGGILKGDLTPHRAR